MIQTLSHLSISRSMCDTVCFFMIMEVTERSTASHLFFAALAENSDFFLLRVT